MMQMVHVFGHQNPDTDAIAAAVVYSYYLNQLNQPSTPFRLGELNKETQFLLEKAHIRLPKKISSLPNDSIVALVDHNDAVQSIKDLACYRLHSVIDHHKLGGLTSPEPVVMRTAMVGSTCTLLYQMLTEKNLSISQQMAMLMSGAIMSDTLNLTSPTTTDADRDALSVLQHIAGIHDSKAFANDLFAAKSDVSDLTDRQLITSDYKQFNFAGNKWGIANIETVDPQQIFKRVTALQQAAAEVKSNDGLDYLLVIIVDILKQQSWAIASDETQDAIISTAFDTSVDDKTLSLGNAVSRKKQFVPALETYYQHHP